MTREEWKRAAAEENANCDENFTWLDKVDAAAAEPGFSGQLRRAIRAARIRPDELALRVGIDSAVLDRFRAGEGTLPTDAVDRLVAVLQLELSPTGVSADPSHG